MVIVLLLCWSAPSDNFGHAYRVYISKSDVRVRLGQYVRHSPGCATFAASLPIIKRRSRAHTIRSATPHQDSERDSSRLSHHTAYSYRWRGTARAAGVRWAGDLTILRSS